MIGLVPRMRGNHEKWPYIFAWHLLVLEIFMYGDQVHVSDQNLASRMHAVIWKSIP